MTKIERWNVTTKRGSSNWSVPIVCPTFKIAMDTLKYKDKMYSKYTTPYTIEIRRGSTRRGKLIRELKK